MILIKQLLDLNRGLTLFSEIFSLNILIPVGKRKTCGIVLHARWQKPSVQSSCAKVVNQFDYGKS